MRQKSLLRSVKKECRGKRLSTREQLTAIRIVTLKEKKQDIHYHADASLYDYIQFHNPYL